MLPTNAPMLPLIMYEEYNFPLSVQVTSPPGCQHLVHKTATALANEASMRANNSRARMYCYNSLVMNNWNNPQFQEVLTQTLLFMALEVEKRNHTSTDMAMKDCVQKYLTLYTSMLVLTVDAVHDVSDSRVVDASAQNAAFFNNLKLELQDLQNRMYQQQLSQPMQNQLNQQIFYNQQGQPVDQFGRPLQMPMQQGYPQQMPMQQPMHSYPQQMPQQFPQQMPMQQPMQQGPVGGFMQQGNAGMMQNPAAANVAGNVERYGNVSVQQKSYAVDEKPQVQKPVPVSKPQPQGLKDVVYVNGDEMDRSKHTITFMGKAYPMDSVVRNNNFNQQVEALKQASAIDDEDSATVVDGNNMILEISEDSVILAGKSKCIAAGGRVFRCFGIATNAILSKDDMTEYKKMLTKASNFEQLALTMKSLSAAFKQASDEWGVEGSQDDKISVIVTVDRRITNLINEFLANNLQLKDVTIDSFTEDYEALVSYVHENCGQMGNLGLSNFGHDVINMFFGTEGDEIDTEVRNLLDVDPLVGCISLSENYTLTYLPMTDRELGYKFDGQLCSVNHGKTPILAKIVDSLMIHKKQGQHTSIHDLIITQDGVIYRVYENIIGRGYLIRKDA
jgi:hypothetical protein